MAGLIALGRRSSGGMRNTPVEFHTEEFVASHRRQPRGMGSWAFELLVGRPIEPAWFPGTYTEARKTASARARLALRIFGVTSESRIHLNVCP